MNRREKKNIRNNLYAIITVFSFILVSVGATFAVFYYVKGNDGSKPINVKTAYVTAMFEATNSIDSKDILPGWSDELKFVITNVSSEQDAIGNYTLMWNIEKNEINSEDFVYTLSSRGFLGSNEITESDTNKTVSVNSPRKVPSVSSSIGTGTINTGVRHEYVLKIMLKESGSDQENLIDKIFKAKVYASGEPNL